MQALDPSLLRQPVFRCVYYQQSAAEDLIIPIVSVTIDACCICAQLFM